MLGCKSILDAQEDADIAVFCDTSTRLVVSLESACHETAAVDVDEERECSGIFAAVDLDGMLAIDVDFEYIKSRVRLCRFWWSSRPWARGPRDGTP
jgi:hypothetical protein